MKHAVAVSLLGLAVMAVGVEPEGPSAKPGETKPALPGTPISLDWLAKYTADPVVDPRGPDKPPTENPLKVIRGGGFYGDFTFAASTAKFAKDLGFTRGDVGFRVVVEAPKAP